ncbi:MAG: DNA cytosine methyltransferase [Firmicutes bacterium]|nr:DNA cytosine methyltransferase [Bacillota bacterium]
MDLLSSDYTCQAFSYAGTSGSFADVCGTVFYYYAEFLRQLKPKIFLAENIGKSITNALI